MNFPLPDFVQARIDWLSDAMEHGGLTFQDAFRMLLDIDDEKSLKEDWELGAVSDYMPVSEEYKEWLENPILRDFRRVAVMVGFIYA